MTELGTFNHMEFRRNIIFSAVLHAMIIIAVFAVSFSVRDMRERLQVDYLTVSLFKEMTGAAPMLSQRRPEPTRTEGSPPEADREGVYKKETASPEPFMSNKTRFFVRPRRTQDTKDEGAQNEIPIYHSLLNTTSEISKGDPPTSPGQHADKSEEITSSQNTGFSLINSSYKGSTGNPYNLIRDAIEKAKTYPFLARKKRIEGTVITGFTINSKGYPQDIKIRKSSGSEILDSAAIKIVMKAAPFPAVDGEIVVPISFKLTGYPPYYISSR